MGWLRRDLSTLRPGPADVAPVPTPEQRVRDAALLEKLEILLDLELLEEWDPDENLPIPITSPSPEAPGGEQPR